jgi:hypothetical protein
VKYLVFYRLLLLVFLLQFSSFTYATCVFIEATQTSTCGNRSSSGGSSNSEPSSGSGNASSGGRSSGSSNSSVNPAAVIQAIGVIGNIIDSSKNSGLSSEQLQRLLEAQLREKERREDEEEKRLSADYTNKYLNMVEDDESTNPFQDKKKGDDIENPAQDKKNGNCHTDLSYLSSRIPSFSQSALEDVRRAILSENLINTMRTARQQGYSAESAIQASLEQARAYDDTVRQALRTAAATDGFGATDDEFLDSLKRGTLKVSTCDGIRNAALCDAINNKLGAIASRATAADMQCHSRAGTWGR